MLDKEHLEATLLKRGIAPFRVKRVMEELLEDWSQNKKTTQEQKEWAFERGFVSDRMVLYGLTDENFTDYISDFDFYSLDGYKNRGHANWYDDKLTTWYLLAPFKSRMPRHYLHLKKGRIDVLDIEKDIYPHTRWSYRDVFELLKDKGELAIKAISGGHGIGFYKVEYVEARDCVLINGIEYSIDRFCSEFLESLEGHLVTEFVKPADSLLEITNGVTCVLRCVSIFNQGESHLTVAMLKFGADPDDVVTDYDGTIYCGIDFESGQLYDSKIRKDTDGCPCLVDCHVHPVSHCPIEGVIPGWETIHAGILTIAEYLQPTPYLTYDIVPVNDGFKVLEINSHGQPRTAQPFFPYFKNEHARALFKEAYERSIQLKKKLES